MTNKYRKSAFSLIELLAVLVISAIVLGITLPSLNTLIKGQSVEQAAINFGSELKAVRSYAITSREYVALIVPTDQSISAEYLYKSYRPCIVDINNNFQFWITDNKWEFLPAGAAIIDIDNNKTNHSGNFDGATNINNVNLSLLKDFSSPTVKGVVFKPTGQTGSRKYIVVGSANIRDGASVDTNQINITIDQYSGRISYGNE